MLTNPSGLDTSDTSAIGSDAAKSAFMEVQPPYATSTSMRGSYGHPIQQSVPDFYGQHAASRLSYPFPSQYSSPTNPFTQSFAGMTGMGGYHTPTSTGREGKSTNWWCVSIPPPTAQP